jgi:NAD(P)-dependent dehydrogenase (short-subunit alcohol dehydrogenase family)
LSPGATDTPIIDGQFSNAADAKVAKQQFAHMAPMGRIGTSEELASAALFLAMRMVSF